jgi:hypothetical protein
MLAFKSQLDSRGIARYIDIILRHELATFGPGNNTNSLRISAKGTAYLEQYAKLITMLEGISGRIDFGWQVPSQA